MNEVSPADAKNVNAALTCMTPTGNAALATLGLSGTDAWSILRSLFRPAAKNTELPEVPPSGQFWLGKLGSDSVADDVVLTAKSPVDLELHCHGGIEVIRFLEETLTNQGATLVSRAEWARLRGKPAWQCEVEAALAEAPTFRTANILLDQLGGAFQNAFANIALDIEAGHFEAATQRLDSLHQRVALGRHLVNPWRVVLAGPVNVGKSSLVNALAGYQRSVVSQLPGTTRDLVTTRLAIAGWPVEITDSAGWRGSDEDLERQGIALAQNAVQQADLVLWVVDGSTTCALPDVDLPRCLKVINKIDLPAGWDFNSFGDTIQVSAATLAGIDRLCDRIASYLVPTPPVEGEAVPPGETAWQLLEDLHTHAGRWDTVIARIGKYLYR